MIRKFVVASLLVVLGATISAGVVETTTARAANCDSEGRILTIRPWYHGLTVSSGGSCEIRIEEGGDGLKRAIGQIAVNIVDMLLQIAGYVAVAFVIYGGFMFMTSSGSPDAAVKSRKTIINALIGLVIALVSVGLVNLVAGSLGLQ